MNKTVAVIGASRNRRKFGNKALRAFRDQGYTVIPIHPSVSDVEGEKAYGSVLDYPGKIDEATVYVSADVGVRVMGEIAGEGIPTVWLNPGADAPAVVARARELGLTLRIACSIIGIGRSPGDY